MSAFYPPDEPDGRYATWAYEGQLRATQSKHGLDNADRFTMSYEGLSEFLCERRFPSLVNEAVAEEE